MPHLTFTEGQPITEPAGTAVPWSNGTQVVGTKGPSGPADVPDPERNAHAGPLSLLGMARVQLDRTVDIGKCRTDVAARRNRYGTDGRRAQGENKRKNEVGAHGMVS